MVFMGKKGATPNKNQQQFKKGKATPSKKVEDFNMDDSDDSDEAPQLQKTPLNKGAKGRQSMSEKKVSFSIPAKNSPAVKTPKKDNSIVSKKALTPASIKGMKGKIVQAVEEDDDEDDEDDDDFEVDDDIDLDIEDDDDDDDDDEEDDDDDDDEDEEEGNDKEAGDEEEDDDDDDEDDEEEDEDEDNKGNMKQKLSMLKEKSPKKEQTKNDKPKKADSPKQKPEKENELQGEILKDEAERRRERNTRMLYIGKLPNDVKEQELKALSKDIVDVSIPMGNRKQPAKAMYAFITFETEAKAEANYKSLQTKKFRGQPLTIDYVGEKSAHDKAMQEGKQGLNYKKLFVSGLSVDATLEQVAKHFKKAFQITFNINPTFRSAVVNFLTQDDAKEAYDNSKDLTIGGHKAIVLYSRQPGTAVTRRKKNNRGKRSHKDNQNGGQSNAKKMKVSNSVKNE